jgi:hypothetical protein
MRKERPVYGIWTFPDNPDLSSWIVRLQREAAEGRALMEAFSVAGHTVTDAGATSGDVSLPEGKPAALGVCQT